MTEQSEHADDDADGYVGLAREDAEERARSQGWTARSLAPGAVVTAEWRSRRINFLVVDGVVQRAWKG
jgi:hypothetical protein